MIKKYKSKPKIIEAVQFDGLNCVEIEVFVGRTLEGNMNGTSKVQELMIPTLEGEHIASNGDYIIKGIRGEFYPCKPEIFEASYEEVNDE